MTKDPILSQTAAKLENLDLSDNSYINERFFAFGSTWLNLKKLKFNNQRDLFASSLEVEDLPGHLPVIKELRISHKDLFHMRSGCWKHLERLDIVVSTIEHGFILPSLIRDAESCALPALQTVCFLSCDDSPSIPDKVLVQLIQKGIDACVADYNLEKMMVNAGLTEQF